MIQNTFAKDLFCIHFHCIRFFSAPLQPNSQWSLLKINPMFIERNVTAFNSLSTFTLLQMLSKEKSFIVEHHNKVLMHSFSSACENISVLSILCWVLLSFMCFRYHAQLLSDFYVHDCHSTKVGLLLPYSFSHLMSCSGNQSFALQGNKLH